MNVNLIITGAVWFCVLVYLGIIAWERIQTRRDIAACDRILARIAESRAQRSPGYSDPQSEPQPRDDEYWEGVL